MSSEPPYHFPHYRNDYGSFVSEVLTVRVQRDAALDKITRTTKRDKRRFLLRQFLNNRSLKLLYFFESVQAKRLLREFPPARMQQVTDELSTIRHYYEVVHPVNLPTGNGTTRTTYSFGPGKHALQRMVADLVEAMFPLPPGKHFTIQGGVRAALEAVEGHVRTGFSYAIERDIAQFYPSVNVAELAKLLRPLPFSVVMNVIAFRPGFVWSASHGSPDALDDTPLPLGGLLAQGSAASPIAAEVLMADLLKGMPDNVRVMSYADNVLILGETLDEVEAANATLEMLVNEHRCGPLRLKPPTNVRNIPLDGLTFLGNDGEWNEDGIEWQPKRVVVDKVLERIETTRPGQEEVFATIDWLLNWKRGYPLWNNGSEQVASYIAQLGARLAYNVPRMSRAYSVGLGFVVTYCRKVYERDGSYPSLAELLPDYQDPLGREGIRPEFIRAVERRLGIAAEGS